MTRSMIERDRRFLHAAIRRKRLFLALSGIGVAVGLGLGVWYTATTWTGARAALVVLVLLNARQNLRQYRYATLLELLGRGEQAAT